MAETVARTGIDRKSDRMYFIKGTTVYSVARGRKGAAHKKEATFRHERDNDYLYYLDGKGNVCRSKRKTAGGRKRKSSKRKSKGRSTKRTTKRTTKKRKSAKRRVSAATERPVRRPAKRKVAKKAAKKSDPKKNALKKAMKELKAMGRGLK